MHTAVLVLFVLILVAQVTLVSLSQTNRLCDPTFLLSGFTIGVGVFTFLAFSVYTCCCCCCCFGKSTPAYFGLLILSVQPAITTQCDSTAQNLAYGIDGGIALLFIVLAYVTYHS